ncbi:MAG TPA: hypothetical protein VK509_19840 [Polyangiales bacterium]|nr:hypothetical protein [Polyangiales bacterium]
MHEALWVLGLVLLVAAWAVFGLVPGDALVLAGQSVMLGSAALGVPLELAYFALLAWALHHNGVVPHGWYWRSFAHHQLLTKRQRLLVMPPFYAGAFAFLGIGLGIAIVVLGFISVFARG